MHQSFQILSLRNISRSPSQNCVSEFEDVFASLVDCRVAAPADIESAERHLAPNGADFLFIACIFIGDAKAVLQKIGKGLSKLGKIVFYVFDGLEPKTAVRPSRIKRMVSRRYRTLRNIDHLFLPIVPSVDVFEDIYQIPVAYCPIGADTLKFGSCSSRRPLDVVAYSRQHLPHLLPLVDLYNRPGSTRFVHFTQHCNISDITDYKRHREHFWRLLSMSQISLAYDILRVPGGRHIPYSFVGQRWMESLAAGCVVVGFRPTSSDADKLLFWQDATIESPEDPQDFLDFIDHLLKDTNRLEETRQRNFRNMVEHHDWCYRIAMILKTIGYESPSPQLAYRMDCLADPEKFALHRQKIEKETFGWSDQVVLI